MLQKITPTTFWSVACMCCWFRTTKIISDAQKCSLS